MKHKIVIEVTAETYEEEQILMNKFPEAWWDDRSGLIVFYIPEEKADVVKEVINEYKERKNERRTRKKKHE